MEKLQLKWDWKRGIWRQIIFRHTATGFSAVGRYAIGRCKVCAAQHLFWGGRGICWDCTQDRHKRQRAVRKEAVRLVWREIKAGRLPRLTGDIPCKDCGRPAEVYEHREYAKPLDVDPVCRRCNSRRGPAIDTLPWIRSLPRRA